ncbi:DUF4169 domain-containing protein [Roseovarius sp. TE539]|uniref:DUF4169 family protein n=1 Tax=Roseovarius sp. TE539 TaxID=2249812 RepID=UPI000DDF58DA|nr:DUF4169 family protein [Roseovarius sp. TE539]RBI75214.1 DUF4169 domain-containing protein [Roseovarius sp. TE539]
MGDKPVNLNRVRKARARADSKARADENAASCGLGKAARRAQAARADKARAFLDRHKRGDE